MEGKNIPPGSDGIVILPYFMGERSPIWDPDARGTVFGLSLSHKKEHIYHALLESAAYSLRHNMETGIEAGMKLNPDCWIVGGVARSTHWVQIFADITGFNMKRLSEDVEAPYGDAFLAGLGTGVFNSSKEIKNWIDFRPLIKTNKNAHKEYEKYYNIFLKLYENTKDLMKEI
jgi:xylulokinase